MKTFNAGNNNKVLSWGSDVDDGTIEQAKMTARAPIVSGHIALMPDAHIGMGATIGSVIPTKDAIIPSAVGVDIGCGMIAVETTLTESDLPDNLDPWLNLIEIAVPAGLGKWHGDSSRRADAWLAAHPLSDFARENLQVKDFERTAYQLGTLGAGNHYLEVGVDERDTVWLVLHSGSRGIGNQLANKHISGAKKLAVDLGRALEDKDLAYFLQSDTGFQAYIDDMLWAQDYALENRAIMMEALIGVVADELDRQPRTFVKNTIQCHHNYTCRENHGGDDFWITRKGAINADAGKLGIIPGSMGTSTFIVEGLGNADSYRSAAHGAGRKMSRTKAKAQVTEDDLTAQMGAVRTWQKDKADQLRDEAPTAYKAIEDVIADMTTLVKPLHEITTILNYKGTS